MALGSTQLLTEISTRNLPGGKGRPAHRAGNLTADCLDKMRERDNPMGLHGLLQGYFYLSTLNVSNIVRLSPSSGCVTAANTICKSLDVVNKYTIALEDTFSLINPVKFVVSLTSLTCKLQFF
jgi:hypothetical protein